MKPFQNRPSTAVMLLQCRKGPADNVGGALSKLVLYAETAVLGAGTPSLPYSTGLFRAPPTLSAGPYLRSRCITAVEGRF